VGTIEGGNTVYFTTNGQDAGVRAIFADGTFHKTAGLGTGATVPSGDRGQATLAAFVTPFGIWVDSARNVLFVSDEGISALQVRMIHLGSGEISLFAGVAGVNVGTLYSGDQGLAVDAFLSASPIVAGDSKGNVYISCDSIVLRVDAGSGIIAQIAGNLFVFNLITKIFLISYSLIRLGDERVIS
jgi:hypothetical protein